jgi:hypothetical protein
MQVRLCIHHTAYNNTLMAKRVKFTLGHCYKHFLMIYACMALMHHSDHCAMPLDLRVRLTQGDQCYKHFLRSVFIKATTIHISMQIMLVSIIIV